MRGKAFSIEAGGSGLSLTHERSSNNETLVSPIINFRDAAKTVSATQSYADRKSLGRMLKEGWAKIWEERERERESEGRNGGWGELSFHHGLGRHADGVEFSVGPSRRYRDADSVMVR